METSRQAQDLNNKPLRAFKAFFGSLSSPTLESIMGVYWSEFTGPGWLRSIAPPGLGLLGLGGWRGKEFAGDSTGINLVMRKGGLQKILPVRMFESGSLADGKPCLAIHYSEGCPFPWPYVIDELRLLDETCLLGLTMINIGILRKLALPFLLHSGEVSDGL